MRSGQAAADHTNSNLRIITMRANILSALTILVLLGAAPLLSACHTTAGAGEDISATGHAITHSADRNTP
jgi:predicted small secreted protein